MSDMWRSRGWSKSGRVERRKICARLPGAEVKLLNLASPRRGQPWHSITTAEGVRRIGRGTHCPARARQGFRVADSPVAHSFAHSHYTCITIDSTLSALKFRHLQSRPDIYRP
jgi:hypothetical protein